jgi:tetratricopeptide (TPR) repeat protein
VYRGLEGRTGELVPLIAEAVDKNPAIPTFRAVLASAQLDAGDEESARALFDEAATTLFSLREDNTWMDGMVNFARVAIGLALGEHSGKLLELLGPYSDQVPEDGLIPLEPVSMFLGGLATVLGRYDDAERYFEEAAELNERGQMMFAEAHTNMLWGRMLRQRGHPGDADRSRTLLEQARTNAAGQDYARIERQAAEELSKLA